VGQTEPFAILPELAAVVADGTIVGFWKGVEIIELVPDGLRIILSVGGLLVRPVCENDGNSDTRRISSGAIIHKRLWVISEGAPVGNDVTRDGEHIAERRWWVGIARGKSRTGGRDRVSRAVEFQKRLGSRPELPTVG
jgi:hypothetical protein